MTSEQEDWSNSTIPLDTISSAKTQREPSVTQSQVENIAINIGGKKDFMNDDFEIRENVRIANSRMRFFFTFSLIVTGALVVVAMVTVVLGLDQAYQNGVSLELVNRARYRSQQITTDAYMILANPTNTSLLKFATNDLNNAGVQLSEKLYALAFGNVSLGLNKPIQNTAVSEQLVLLAPLENAMLTAIQNIYEEVFSNSTNSVNLTIMDELKIIIASQSGLLADLDDLNTLVSAIFFNGVVTGQTEIYVFNGVILGILILEALFIFIPLERRSRRVLEVLTMKNENLNRLMKNLTILTQLNPNGIFRADNQGVLTYVNTRWLEITGLPADCEPSQWLSHVHSDDQETFRIQHDNVLRDPTFSVAIEFRFIRPDGREIWIFCQCISEKDNDKILSLVGALTDITERKLLEQNTFNALAHAAQVQQQRAQEAEQHRLEQVRFIDMICHEIRNPLNGLVNNVDTLLQNRQAITQVLATGLLNETKTQILPILREEDDMWRAVELCIHHQKRITDDVLHIFQLQSGQVSVQERSFVLGRMVDSVLLIFHAEAESSQIRLTASYSSSCSAALRLKCDSNHTAQILINLVANAIKFTKQCQTRTIDIKVDLQDQDSKALLIFRVKDTGIGMTQEEVAKLFIPFGQANTKTYTNYGGSGMGLFLSRALVDLMNGSISVQSQPDIGSTFEFQVPCLKLSPDAPIESDEDIQSDRPLFSSTASSLQDNSTSTSSLFTTEASTATLTTEPVTLTTEPATLITEPAPSTTEPEESTPQQFRILIVEDNDINQKVLRRQLESVPNGMFVATIASNGQEAVDLVAQSWFDLIVMDVEMPVLDGLEATKKIRELEQNQSTPSVPIVGLSGNARPEHIEQGKASGMTDYLVKPCRRPELLKCIAMHLRIAVPV